jgi:hypothetical protein
MNGPCGSPYEASLHSGLPSSSSAMVTHVGQSHHQHHHHLNGGGGGPGGVSSMSFSSPYDIVGPPPPSMQHIAPYGGSASSVGAPGCGGATGSSAAGGGGGSGGTPVTGFAATAGIDPMQVRAAAAAGAGSPWYAPSPVSDPRFASKLIRCVLFKI